MDQLLDDVDSLPHPDLTALAGSWCESCEALRQEVKRLQEDQVQNFSKLKQKIISTDLLIKKYKSKCDDYDNQTKRLEETTRRLEEAQRQAETLELQLKSSLLETEPLRKSKYNLEVELRTKNAEVEDAVNKMVCAQGLQQQIQGENKYLQDQVDKLEQEKRELKEKVHHFKQREKEGESVKQLKAEVSTLKKEISTLRKENAKQLKKEQALEAKLQETVEKMDHYCTMLKQHKLLSAAKRSLPHHYRSPGKSYTTSDSDVGFDSGRDASILNKDLRKSVEGQESSSDDDDNHSLFQVPWVFSPLAKCLSPLPPSPACFAQKQDSLICKKFEADTPHMLQQYVQMIKRPQVKQENDDDEYLSDLAEELESQLMDIFSEDETSEVDNTGKKTSQTTVNHDNLDLDNAHNEEDSNLHNGAESIWEDDDSNTVTDIYSDEASKSAILDSQKDNLDGLENIQIGTDDDDMSLSAELAEAASHCDSVCKDILDNIVNEILGDAISEIEEKDTSVDLNVEQTLYCNDTTVIRTPSQKSKLGARCKSIDFNNKENDTEKQQHALDEDAFKSPKSIKERLKDSAQIISPVCTRRRSAEKVSKSGTTSSPRNKNQTLAISQETVSKGSLDSAQINQCSENISDLNLNLNRSDTGEFTPALHEIESPSPVSKEKIGFFLSGQDSTCVHSIKDLSLPVNSDDKNSAIENKYCEKGTNEESATAKPVLRRQMALRKDSASDLVPENKMCSKSNESSQSTVKESRRITRSKSMPNKYINFQKGTCKTLAEEMVKFDVSKGGYDKGAKMDDHVEKTSEEKADASNINYTNDSIEVEKANKKKLKNSDTPIPMRTRRSSRLSESLSDTNSEYISSRRRRSSGRSVTSEEDMEKPNSAGKAHRKLSENTSDEIRELSENKDRLQEDESVPHKENKSSAVEQADKTNTIKISKPHQKKGSDPKVDSKGDSLKTQSEISTTSSSSETVIGDKGETVESVSSLDSSEDTTVDAVSKATPSRQLSTGFKLRSPVGIDKQKRHFASVSLKETILEENENTNENDEIVNDGVPVILDVNDILNDNESEDTVIKESDEIAERDSKKKWLDPDELLVGIVSDKSIGDNDENDTNQMEHTSEGLASPSASPCDLFISDKQSTEMIEEMEILENNVIESGSTSVIPDDVSGDEMPVLSPFSMSAFEMVTLISPLPPTPNPMDELNEHLSTSSEDEDADKTLTEDDVMKSPENADKIPNVTEFNTPKNKLPNDIQKLHFSPLPALLSPIITPKKLKTSEKSISKKTKAKTSATEPCKFITEVPSDVNIKPTAVHVQNVNETVTETPTIRKSQDQIETESTVDDTSPGQKENRVPNKLGQQKVKKTSKTALINISSESEQISKLGAKESKETPNNSEVVKIDRLMMDQNKDKQSTVASKHSENKDKQSVTGSDPSEDNVNQRLIDSVPFNDKQMSNDLGNSQQPGTKPPSGLEKAESEKKTTNIVPEITGGYDNLVASKTKTRQAHQPKGPRLPIKKPVPIIEAPALLPVNRKRKNPEVIPKDKEKEQEVEEKKPCKEHLFKRRQKSESKAKSAVSKVMQNFLKSFDPPESLLTKLETEDTGGETGESTEQRAFNTCFDCLSRIKNDTLDAVHESCTTDDYLNVIDDWPYLFPVEKQAIELCWHISQAESQTLTRSSIMEELWKRIFSMEQSSSISGKKSLCRIFTALCFKAGNVEEVRVLFYHIVVCGYLTAPSFLVPVISVWPETLRRENDEDHGMMIVLEHVLMQMLKTQDSAASKQIQECVVKLCNWIEDRGTADDILAKLLQKLEEVTENKTDLGTIRLTNLKLGTQVDSEWLYCVYQDQVAAVTVTPTNLKLRIISNQVFGLTKSIELLTLKEGSDWFYKRFVNFHCLQRVCNKWVAKGRNCGLTSLYICSVLRMSGTLLAQFHSRQKFFNDTIRHWVLPILRKEPGCPEVQESCIELILEVSCFNPKMISNLQGWYYHYKGSVRPELVTRMEMVWQEYSKKFDNFRCHPFVNKFKLKKDKG